MLVLKILCALLITMLLVLIFLFDEILALINFNKLLKNDLLSKNISFEAFQDIYSIVKTGFNMSCFEIAYFKDEKLIVKIKKNYFMLSDTGSLIYLFNEKEYLLKKFEEVRKG